MPAIAKRSLLHRIAGLSSRLAAHVADTVFHRTTDTTTETVSSPRNIFTAVSEPRTSLDNDGQSLAPTPEQILLHRLACLPTELIIHVLGYVLFRPYVLLPPVGGVARFLQHEIRDDCSFLCGLMSHEPVLDISASQVWYKVNTLQISGGNVEALELRPLCEKVVSLELHIPLKCRFSDSSPWTKNGLPALLEAIPLLSEKTRFPKLRLVTFLVPAGDWPYGSENGCFVDIKAKSEQERSQKFRSKYHMQDGDLDPRVQHDLALFKDIGVRLRNTGITEAALVMQYKCEHYCCWRPAGGDRLHELGGRVDIIQDRASVVFRPEPADGPKDVSRQTMKQFQTVLDKQMAVLRRRPWAHLDPAI